LRCRPAVPAPGEIGDAFGKRRVDARAADPLVEEPGGEKGAVADHRRGQAKARSAREEAILRVARQELGRRVRALPVGRRENDRPQEALESVARLAELDRELIEELGMARQRAADAEVARRLDDPATEEGLPDAVRDDAREERISLIDDPTREAETVSRRAVGKRMEELGHAGLDRLTRLEELAAMAEPRRPRIEGSLIENERRREARHRSLALRDLGVHRRELGRDVEEALLEEGEIRRVALDVGERPLDLVRMRRRDDRRRGARRGEAESPDRHLVD